MLFAGFVVAFWLLMIRLGMTLSEQQDECNLYDSSQGTVDAVDCGLQSTPEADNTKCNNLKALIPTTFEEEASCKELALADYTENTVTKTETCQSEDIQDASVDNDLSKSYFDWADDVIEEAERLESALAQRSIEPSKIDSVSCHMYKSSTSWDWSDESEEFEDLETLNRPPSEGNECIKPSLSWADEVIEEEEEKQRQAKMAIERKDMEFELQICPVQVDEQLTATLMNSDIESIEGISSRVYGAEYQNQSGQKMAEGGQSEMENSENLWAATSADSSSRSTSPNGSDEENLENVWLGCPNFYPTKYLFQDPEKSPCTASQSVQLGEGVSVGALHQSHKVLVGRLAHVYMSQYEVPSHIGIKKTVNLNSQFRRFEFVYEDGWYMAREWMRGMIGEQLSRMGISQEHYDEDERKIAVQNYSAHDSRWRCPQSNLRRSWSYSDSE